MVNDWLKITEVANLMGVHPSTVRNWSNEGKIPYYRTQGGHRRYQRSQVHLWLQGRKPMKSNYADLFVEQALKGIRLSISDLSLEKEPWYQKLDEEARQQYAHSGRLLLHGLRAYLSSDGDHSEARALGFEYASRGRMYGLHRLEAVSAYLFFRNSLLGSLFAVYESSMIESPIVWANMLRKVTTFTDQILVSLLENYEVANHTNQTP
ncbi:MAG: helix-turn-helix domain-containing protein [Chloroflexota bacterium]